MGSIDAKVKFSCLKCPFFINFVLIICIVSIEYIYIFIIRHESGELY